MPPSAAPRRRLAWSLAIGRHDVPQAHVLAVSGRLAFATAPALESALHAALMAGHPQLRLDVSGVDYVSSAGLSVIERATAEARRAGGRLVLCGLQEAVRVSLEVSGAGQGLDIIADLEQTLP